ncbi:MAG: hypothetical protein LBH18_01120, partial [Spirochaetaceae bacterium]|nr:hypothetical protein [Spirochaetaceae bacterium]
NKTIKLELSKTSGNAGLFNSLAPGAKIEDLNVVVSTEDGKSLQMDGDSHFGGVLGVVNMNGACTLSNISVSGVLKYGKPTRGNYLIVGGLIGEIESVDSNYARTTIENCYSDITIEADLENWKGNDLYAFGGLIGKVAPFGNGNKTIVKNSYSTGSIDVSAANDIYLVAGGLIGDIALKDLQTKNINFEITNCYSAVSVKVQKTISGTPNKDSAAGGLIGRISVSSTGNKVENCVVLNPHVLTIASAATNGNDPHVWNNRMVGRLATSNAGTLNNYALSGILTGTTSTGTSNTGQGAEEDTNITTKDAAWFSNKDNWIGLGFDTGNWDFTGLKITNDAETSVYPKLKKVSSN